MGTRPLDNTKTLYRYIYNHWRKSRGDGGMYPPHFFGWGGWPVQTSPPLFEDKITLNLTFIVEKLTFLTVKLLVECITDHTLQILVQPYNWG